MEAGINIKPVIEFLKGLEQEKIIEGYALAGGIALLFYIEPISTYDMDFFILYSKINPSGFVDLGPLYEAAEKKGYQAKEEHILIGKIPIQLLPTPSDLETEAVKEAIEHDYEGDKIKVVSLEHLMAIMLKVNRSKNKERILKILDEKIEFDSNKLDRILAKYDLKHKWSKIIGKTE